MKNAGPDRPEQIGLLPSPHTGAMERLHGELAKILNEREFASLDEAKAFMREKVTAGDFNHLLDGPGEPEGPIEQAQELCWQACDADTHAEAKKLYKKALSLDPDCTEALVFEAAGARSPEAALGLLEHAVLTAGERLGGARYLRENKGHFWGLLETRPYMRAKLALAEIYREMDRPLDAIAEFEHMLDLCPNDNLGIRYSLLGRYIRVGEYHRARRLLKQYGDEDSPMFLYGRLFLEVLSENFSKAKQTLKRAIASNRHVYDYLIGAREEMPEQQDFYSPGDESEAAICLESLQDAFLCNPPLLLWMIEQAKHRGDQPASAMLQ